MKGHEFGKIKAAWPLWGCSCGRRYNVSTVATARECHAGHVEHEGAARELPAALARWQEDPAQLFLDVGNLCDWAERDQDECRQCGDEDGEAEAKENMKIVDELRRAIPALLTLQGWRSPKFTKAEA